MKFRKGNKGDIQAISEIEQNVFGEDSFDFDEVKYLLEKANATTIVAEGEEIQGYAIMLWRSNSSKSRLYSIAVKPEYSGKGIGKVLLKECEKEAKKRNCSSITLEVRVDNDRARGLYTSVGYEEIQPLPRYYARGKDGVRMEKIL